MGDIRDNAIYELLPSNCTVLDAGCGDGRRSKEIAELGHTVYAVDINCKSNWQNTDNLFFSNSDLNNIDTLPKQDYDVVVCCEVLEHMPDYKDILQNLLMFAKKKVIITIPHKKSFFVPGEPPEGHCNFWDDVLNDNYKDITEFKELCYPYDVKIQRIRTKPEDIPIGQYCYLIVIDKESHRKYMNDNEINKIVIFAETLELPNGNIRSEVCLAKAFANIGKLAYVLTKNQVKVCETINPDLIIFSFKRDEKFINELIKLKSKIKSKVIYLSWDMITIIPPRLDYFQKVIDSEVIDLFAVKEYTLAYESFISKGVWIDQGIDLDIYGIANRGNEEFDIAFSGSFYNSARIDILRRISERWSLVIYSADYVAWGRAIPKATIRPPKYAFDYKDIISSAKIHLGLNMVNNIKGAWSNRGYMIMACGGCLLSEYVPMMSKCFDRQTMRWFTNFEDMLIQITQLLSDDKWKVIGDTARQFIKENHTYTHVAYDILNKLMVRRIICGHELIDVELMKDIPNDSVCVEIGATQSHGSTAYLSILTNKLKLKKLYCVDISADVIMKAEESVIEENVEFICKDGAEFLENIKEEIGILYLDGGDITYFETGFRKETKKYYKDMGITISNEWTYELNLNCCRAIKNKIVDNGYIVFDDTWLWESQWHGKGTTAIPFLLENGFVVDDIVGVVVRLKKQV